MKIKTVVFFLLFSLGLVAMLSGFFYSRDIIPAKTFFDIERQMLSKTSFDPSQPLKEEWSVNDIQVSNYFVNRDDNWTYKGGLESNLVLDQVYNKEDVENHLAKIVKTEKNDKGFVSFDWVDNNVYVLIDNIDSHGVANFLKALDRYQDNYFERLVIDLRFIREVDIPLMIRMLNQWCGLEDFTFDSIQSSAGDTEITSSGKPFFQAEKYYFLVSKDSPLSLLHLLRRLSHHHDYFMVGQVPEVPARICVEKTYTIEDRHYSICDFMLVDEESKGGFEIKDMPSTDILENYKTMSRLLYSESPARTEEQISKTMKKFLESLPQKD